MQGIIGALSEHFAKKGIKPLLLHPTDGTREVAFVVLDPSLLKMVTVGRHISRSGNEAVMLSFYGSDGTISFTDHPDSEALNLEESEYEALKAWVKEWYEAVRELQDVSNS